MPVYTLWGGGGVPPLPNTFFGFDPATLQVSALPSGSFAVVGTGIQASAGTPALPPPYPYVPCSAPSTEWTAGLVFYLPAPGIANTYDYAIKGGRIAFDLMMNDSPANYDVVVVSWGRDATCIRTAFIYPFNSTLAKNPSVAVPALSSTGFVTYSFGLHDFVVDCPDNTAGMGVNVPFRITAGRKNCGAPASFVVDNIRWTP